MLAPSLTATEEDIAEIGRRLAGTLLEFS
jgi:DNA-binding LacI/PurR family transcriptional regulator